MKQSKPQLMPSKAVQILKYAPTGAEFTTMFNLDSCTEKYLKYKSVEECLTTGMIKLREISAAYGDKLMVAWVQAWLINLAMYMNFEISKEQVKTTAIMILEECYMLNIAEYTFMFRRILKGHYGIFYGKYNGQTIINACVEFRKERGKILAKLSSEQQKQLI